MFLRDDLEAQYAPRKWAKRTDPGKVVPLHVEICKNGSDAARNNVPCQLNILYGENDREKFDIYGIDLPSDASIFIYLHGGYWQSLSKETSSFAAEVFYKHGIKFIALGYDICPNVSFGTMVEEVQKAFKKCLKYARDNESRGVYLCGHSAGAHLIVCIFQQLFYSLSADDKNITKAAFLFSGLYDLSEIVDTSVNDNLKLDKKEAKKFSPLFGKIDASKDMPFLVLVGEYESVVFHEQSIALHSKLKSDGYKSHLIIVKQKDHFDIVENLGQEDYEIVQTIFKIMKN